MKENGINEGTIIKFKGDDAQYKVLIMFNDFEKKTQSFYYRKLNKNGTFNSNTSANLLTLWIFEKYVEIVRG